MELHPIFIENMQALLGEDYPAFEAAQAETPVKALRVNTLKISIEEALARMDFLQERVPWAQDGFYHTLEKTGSHPFSIAGLLYSQDASAMAPAAALSPVPGEKVLDLCAAPGGKTTQLAAMMQGEGLLVANEIIPSRAKILYENTERMGIVNCVITNESPDRLKSCFPGYFDKILVDAPCSGEGMFRKDAAALREWKQSSNTACAARQLQILSSAAHMLRPGGALVYSTCTFSPVENEELIVRFLERFPEFEAVPIALPALTDGFSPLEKTKRIWPHIQKGEGHFIAKLTKKDGQQNKAADLAPAAEKSLKSFREFEKTCFTAPIPGIPYLIHDTVYLFLQRLPEMNNLRRLNMGICAGTLAKGRFEPHHQLARCLEKKMFRHVFSLDDETLYRYVAGETFDTTLAGWCGAFYGAWGIGLAKGAAGILKNHYPKGLRTYLKNRL